PSAGVAASEDHEDGRSELDGYVASGRSRVVAEECDHTTSAGDGEIDGPHAVLFGGLDDIRWQEHHGLRPLGLTNQSPRTRVTSTYRCFTASLCMRLNPLGISDSRHPSPSQSR